MSAKFLQCYFILLLILISTPSHALNAWNIISNTHNDTQMQVAYTENGNGYSLEIYRDANDVVRSRFTIKNGLILLADKHCPTYQIDRRDKSNRSINDAKCIVNKQWAEFILGYITDNEIRSTALHNMMNGNKITYRFILNNGTYGEVDFSLSGSKRILSSIIGGSVTVRTDNGFSIDE